MTLLSNGFPEGSYVEFEIGQESVFHQFMLTDSIISFLDICLQTKVIKNGISICLSAEKTPVSSIILHIPFNFQNDVRIYGDTWERSYGDLHWEGIVPERCMPWFFLAYNQMKKETFAFGVAVRPNSFCSWYARQGEITLVMDVRCGGVGVELDGRTLEVATVMMESYSCVSAFSAGQAFCRKMCQDPIFPKEPVYGSNNWYYAYGISSAKEILSDAAFVAEMTKGLPNRPFMVIDDGWQENPCAGPWDHGNQNFPNMKKLAEDIRKMGVRPGIWLRLLCDKGNPLPESWRHPRREVILDPSVPEVLEHIKVDIRRLREWGFELIKHDYSTYDLFGSYGYDMKTQVAQSGWHFADRTRTSAEIVLNFYRAIREAAGNAIVLGCNTFSHLCAGLVEVNRTGDDISGKEWWRTRNRGVNTLAFRMMQNGAFYVSDADCIGITEHIPWKQNREWLWALAKSGSPLFVSCSPKIATPQIRSELKDALAQNSIQKDLLIPDDWLWNNCPENWELNGSKKKFIWFMR